MKLFLPRDKLPSAKRRPAGEPIRRTFGTPDARDWHEKTEDWQVETGRGARSLLAEDSTLTEDAAEVAL